MNSGYDVAYNYWKLKDISRVV